MLKINSLLFLLLFLLLLSTFRCGSLYDSRAYTSLNIRYRGYYPQLICQRLPKEFIVLGIWAIHNDHPTLDNASIMLPIHWFSIRWKLCSFFSNQHFDFIEILLSRFHVSQLELTIREETFLERFTFENVLNLSMSTLGGLHLLTRPQNDRWVSLYLVQRLHLKFGNRTRA